MVTLKTGEDCKLAGKYRFQRYLDGRSRPQPTREEFEIPLDVGDKAPPVKSQNASAVWARVSS